MAEINESPMKHTRVTLKWIQKEKVFRAKAEGLVDVEAEGSDRLSALYTLERLMEVVGRYAEKCGK